MFLIETDGAATISKEKKRKKRNYEICSEEN
jgi:hypothetical protein